MSRRTGSRGRARRIVTVTAPNAAVLRRRSRAVSRVDAAIQRLVADMVATMRRANGVGLAAVQIGVPLRVLVADTGRGILALVNPRLRRRSGEQIGTEGCLSVPGVLAAVRRARKIAVDGTLITGRRVSLRASDYVARVLQHEIDHLNGVLFLDRVRASSIRKGRRSAAARAAAARRRTLPRRDTPPRRRPVRSARVPAGPPVRARPRGRPRAGISRA